MLETAVSVLSQLPTRLEVLSEDGGAITLEITGHDADTIHALAPLAGVRVGLRLRLRERDAAGGDAAEDGCEKMAPRGHGVPPVRLASMRRRWVSSLRARERLFQSQSAESAIATAATATAPRADRAGEIQAVPASLAR